MKPQTLNKVINYLLIYLVGLVLLLGFFGEHLVDDMARFVYLYGTPLLIIIIIYVLVTAEHVFTNISKKTKIDAKTLSIISIKLCLAITPMFYLDNSFASLLSALRLE